MESALIAINLLGTDQLNGVFSLFEMVSLLNWESSKSLHQQRPSHNQDIKYRATISNAGNADSDKYNVIFHLSRRDSASKLWNALATPEGV